MKIAQIRKVDSFLTHYISYMQTGTKSTETSSKFRQSGRLKLPQAQLDLRRWRLMCFVKLYSKSNTSSKNRISLHFERCVTVFCWVAYYSRSELHSLL